MTDTVNTLGIKKVTLNNFINFDLRLEIKDKSKAI